MEFKLKGFTLIIILFFVFNRIIAQELTQDYETLLLNEENEEIVFSAFKPVIGVSRGVFRFYGDVRDVYYKNPFAGRYATSAVISRNINRNFDFELFVTFGKITGNENITKQNKNFETDLFLGGVALTYNFMHILKRKRPIAPFLSLGIETLQFSPKGDKFDEQNREYYYASDGTIRDNIDRDIIIKRDYKYETDLRGNQNYSLMSFAIPIDFGVNIIIADRMTLRLGNAYHLTFTDYIDNYKKGSGMFSNDRFLYSYASLRLDLFSPAEEIIAVENFKNLKFTITDNIDSDEDGIDDFNDECPDTPLGIKVSYSGCPEDEDHDGVPDYLDKQLNTPTDAVAVSDKGIRIIDTHLISILYDPDAVDRKELMNYYKGGQGDKQGKEQKQTLEIPQKFKFLDINQDNYISIEELQKAIDGLFDFSTSLTVDDIYELQEFFFEQ